MVDEDRPLSTVDQKFVENALDVVKLRFVRNEQDFSSSKIEQYGVDFAHQHFGESETIFGYQNLSVTINYTASTLYIYPEFNYTRTSNEGGSIPPDDLYGLLQNQLPTGNFSIMVDSKKEFMKKLAEQKNFAPFGTKIASFAGTSQVPDEPVAKRAKNDLKAFELYKVTENGPQFETFLAQLQTVALWYIDAAEYTDNSDERWMHYILYEIYYEPDESGQLCKRHAIAGYCSLFRFYRYPDQYRARIAHLLLFPNHRNTGMGAKFLDAINKDLRTISKLYDITVEDAADSMIYLRDYVDCVDCLTLPEFSDVELRKGFSPVIQEKALEKFKIHSKQARRVYEILRYISTNKEDNEELKRYRIDVKRRLEKPLKRRAKDNINIKRAFDEETANQLCGNPEVIKAQLASLYEETIKGYEIGIFESPTGTGKTLSVVCSTMTWLEKFQLDTEAHLIKVANTKIEVNEKTQDWINAYKDTQDSRKSVEEAKTKLEELSKVREKLRRAEETIVETKKRRLGTTEKAEEDEDFGPEEYNSDKEDASDSTEEERLKTVKVYYASRTHSQLGQIVDELAKTRFKPRLVTIASRQALCANENVQKLKINHLINEKCMELRKNCGSCAKKSKTNENKVSHRSASSGCPYYRMEAIEDLSNGILSKRLLRPDKLISSAQKSMACPYFATRKSVPLCQLVLLPYQVLLHSATRAAWNIELEGNVIVLDEAHNVLQTIGNIHSCEVSYSSLKVALHLVKQYIETYKLRLKTKNLMYMRQLLTVVSAFDRYLQIPSTENVLTIQGFLIKLQLTGINLFKLVHYIETTDLCRKFHGFYLRHQKNKQQVNKTEEKHSGLHKLLNKKKEEDSQPAMVEQSQTIPSPLFSIKAFIEALNNKCEDGRIIVENGSGGNTPAKLKFILLNPASQLQAIVDKARATVLIGGTMEPAGLLFDCLTRGRDPSKVKRFSCEHVIEPNQLAAFIVDKTSNNKQFSLTYQTRGNDETIRSLAISLFELVKLIPNGCVTFFTSYDVMTNFVNFLKKSDLFSKLEERKKVYVEPRAGGDPKIWEMFVTAARTSKGAILFAVVGGKMSEGINFSDELGRAVIMVGLPYPNKNSIELQENMKYLNATIPGGGKQLYDSLCMHAVNQAIGRAIRHRKDYAAVYLFDSRFSQPAVKTQLSTWISRRLQMSMCFNEVLQKTRTFFAQNE